jgi:hypothetical protein
MEIRGETNVTGPLVLSGSPPGEERERRGMNVATAELDLVNSVGNGTDAPPSRRPMGRSTEVYRPAPNRGTHPLTSMETQTRETSSLWAVRTGVLWRSERLHGPLTRSRTLRLGLRPEVSGAHDVISVSSGGLTLDNRRMHLVELFDTGNEADSTTIYIRMYRYTAYRNLIRWSFGWLGKHTQKPLPSCVLHTIRNMFPNEDDDEFLGQRHARPLLS